MNWDSFKKGEFCINCETLNDYFDFLKECKNNGITKWSSERKILENRWLDQANWSSNKENTILIIKKFKYIEGFMFGNKSKYKKMVKWEIA